ncbi:MAG: hypothetical protein K2J77_11440 [Oscillospiraceae bacterium]|nr:hypothetical protein [Oscillospiraceae bacterium]
MPYFTKKELIMSLCCPVITFLWGFYNFVFGIPYGRDLAEISFWIYLSLLVGLAALLAGGVLPIVLTWRQKIRTDRFFIKRIIIIAVVFWINRYGIDALPFEMTFFSGFVLYMIVNVTAVLLQYLTVKDEDVTKGERAVLVLSDPILWWAVNYFVDYMAILPYM